MHCVVCSVYCAHERVLRVLCVCAYACKHVMQQRTRKGQQSMQTRGSARQAGFHNQHEVRPFMTSMTRTLL